MGKIIQKIIFYRKKNMVAFLLVFLASALMIACYLLYNYTDSAMRMSDAERLYGTYDLCVRVESEEMKEIILRTEGVSDSVSVDEEYRDWTEKKDAYWYCVEQEDIEDFLAMTNFELAAGRIPSQPNEILCEDEFLSLNGYFFDRDGEVDVEIGGTVWHISGTFAINESLRTVDEVYTPIFIAERSAAGEGAETWLYLDVGKAVAGQVEEKIQVAYQHNHRTVAGEEEEEEMPPVYENAQYLSAVGVNVYGESVYPWLRIQRVIAYVVLILLIYMLIQIVNLALREKTYDFAVLVSHGITAGRITRQYARILLFAALANLAIALQASSLYFVILTGGSYPEVFLNAAWRIFLVDLVFLTGVTLIVLLRCRHLLSVNIAGNLSVVLANRENIPASPQSRKNPKHRRRLEKVFDGEPRLIPPLAENMLRKKRGAYVLFTVSIILGILTMNLYTYVVNEVMTKNHVADYEYRVKYLYNSGRETFLGIEGMDETWLQLKESGIADLMPVFYEQTMLSLSTADLGKGYLNYLEDANTNLAADLAAGTMVLDVGCAVIGVDAESLEKLCGIKNVSFSNDECYVLSNVEEENGRTLRLGLEEGDQISLASYYSVETEDYSGVGERIQSLTVVGTADQFNAMQDEFYGMPVILVNMSVYQAIANYQYPTWIYLNRADGVSEKELTDYFRSLSNIILINNAREVQNAKRLWFQTMVPMFFIGACLLAALFVNVYIVLSTSYEENRRQLAMLSALGVRERDLISLQLCLNRRLFVWSIVFGNLLSVGGCYLFYLLLVDYDSYAEFCPPYRMMAAVTAMVAVVFVALTVVMRRKIRKMNVVEELAQE